MSTLQGNTTTIENLLRSVNNLPNVGADDAVLYIDQTLTDAQKAQARTNIGAASAEEVAGKMDKVTGTPDQVVGFDEAGNPVAREAPSGGGGGVQPDWNQADETAPDFIKNKPFGERKQVIVPQSDAPFTFSDDFGLFSAIFEPASSLSEGVDTEVVWDGIAYSSKPLDSGDGALYFGNLSLMGLNDTGEPFIGIYMDGAIVLCDLAAAEVVTRNISISVAGIDKIAEEYIPFSVVTYYANRAYGDYVYLDAECSAKVTFFDAYSDIKRGIVRIIANDNGAILQLVPRIAAPTGDGAYYFKCLYIGDADVYFYTAEHTG